MSHITAHNLNEKLRTDDILVDEKYSFHSFLLSIPVLEGLKNSGFYKPSPIQIKAIPLAKCGLDLIVKAKSGTGKTVVFSVIALETVQTNINEPQVLILAPTREIAVQIQTVIKSIGGNIKDLKVHSFIGGLPIEDDIKNIDKCHIVVGAPGRLRSLLEKKHLKTKSLRLIVLDEADKLMEEAFQNDINFIYSKLPSYKQTLAVSATYSENLCEFLKKYMHSPSFVSTEGENSLLLGIRQYVTVVKEHLNINRQIAIKTEELIRLLLQISYTQCLVFFNTQSRAQGISNTLNNSGWKTLYISAAQSQSDRLKVINSLKKFECRILLSTDLTARGIDAANVDFVINYDIPYDSATYLHRMGRAGRYGSQGLCISIAGDNRDLKHLQSLLGKVGGEVLSIARLSNSDDIASNKLWECDYDLFEKVYGVSSDSNPNYNEVAEDIDAKITSSGLKHLTITGDSQSECKDKINKEDANDKRLLLDTDTIFRNLAAGKAVSTGVNGKCANVNEHLPIDTEASFKTLASEGDIYKEEVNKEDVINKYVSVNAETLFTSLAAGDNVSFVLNEKCTNVNKHTLIDTENSFKILPFEDNEVAEDIDAKITSLGLKHLTVTGDLQSECNDKINKEDTNDKHLLLDTETLFRNLAAGDAVSTGMDGKCENVDEHLSIDTEASFKTLASEGDICKEEVNKEDLINKYAFVSAETLFTSLALGDNVSLVSNEKCTNVNKHTLIDTENSFKILPSEDKEKINENGLDNEHCSVSTESFKSLEADDGGSLLIDVYDTDEKLVKPNTLPTEDIALASNKIEGMNDWHPWFPVEGYSVFNSDENRINLLDDLFKQRKRKRNENNEITMEQEIHLRNLSLFSACQLIEGDVREEELDTHIDCIKKYLNCLKNEKQTQEMNKIKKLDNLDDFWKNIDTNVENLAEYDDKNAPMENIFTLGYNHMIKNGMSWIEALGDDYNPENPSDENQSDFEEEEEAEDYNEEEEDYYEEDEDAEHKYYDWENDKQDNPQTQKTQVSEGCSENLDQVQVNNCSDMLLNANPTYEQYFDYYGKRMCRDRNSFEDIGSFVRYFNNWQQQIQQCKDFISQQIYVQSMNSYIMQQQNSDSYNSYNENNLEYCSTYYEDNSMSIVQTQNSTTNLPSYETNQYNSSFRE